MAAEKTFGEDRIDIGNGEDIYCLFMNAKNPKRVIFLPPLVGGSASLQLILFRELFKIGSTLFSFEYRGHKHSDGYFTLKNSIEDTQKAFDFIKEYSKDKGLYLHGMGTCYSSIPLLTCFENGENLSSVTSLSTISGLFDMKYVLKPEDFAEIFSIRKKKKINTTELVWGIINDEIDLEGDDFRNALRDYLIGLFPELKVGRDFFEELDYSKVKAKETLLEFYTHNPLDGIEIPSSVPFYVFGGTKDRLLGLNSPEKLTQYKKEVNKIVPHARIIPLDIDHFGRGVEHYRIAQELSDMFNKNEGN